MTPTIDDASAGAPALSGRTALITAAASGMGRSAALLFAAHGAHVIAADIDDEGVARLVAEIEHGGGSAEGHVVDLGDLAGIEDFLADIVAKYEVLDVLYNHAGVRGPVGLDFDAASWDACFAINVRAQALATQRLLPLLRRSESASIIFTASTAGLVGVPSRLAYSATKGAIIQFTKSIALLVAPDGIRANAICPGATNTAALQASNSETAIAAIGQSVPLGRVAEPTDIANLALFLASDASKYITGTVIPVDGGVTASAR